MEMGQMQRQLVEYARSLFIEGFLDAQFLQLQDLQDGAPGFIAELVSIFSEDSERLLIDVAAALDQQSVDFKWVDDQVHKLTGSSASASAPRVTNACTPFRNFCKLQDIEGCLRCLQQAKQEFYLWKSKIDTLLRLQQQIVAAGGSIPKLEFKASGAPKGSIN